MKILPFLVIGILVLSGFGVYAIDSDDSEELNKESQGVIRVTARGGRGITVIIRNWGIAPIDLRDTGMIFISLNHSNHSFNSSIVKNCRNCTRYKCR